MIKTKEQQAATDYAQDYLDKLLRMEDKMRRRELTPPSTLHTPPSTLHDKTQNK